MKSLPVSLFVAWLAVAVTVAIVACSHGPKNTAAPPTNPNAPVVICRPGPNDTFVQMSIPAAAAAQFDIVPPGPGRAGKNFDNEHNKAIYAANCGNLTPIAGPPSFKIPTLVPASIPLPKATPPKTK